MSYPVGITLRALTFGPAFIMEDGSVVGMSVAIKATRSLVWRATGSPLLTVSKSFAAAEGMEGSFLLPVTDQVGWGDGKGGVIDVSGGKHSHLYTATITYTYAGGSIGTVVVGPFALPAGNGSAVDIDDMLPATTAQGTSVLIPDSWSAAVAAAQAAAEAAAAGGGSGPTAYSSLPAGMMVGVEYNGLTGWPARPTTRHDLIVVWMDKLGLSTAIPTDMVLGVDLLGELPL
jgi:hypothetical protein